VTAIAAALSELILKRRLIELVIESGQSGWRAVDRRFRAIDRFDYHVAHVLSGYYHPVVRDFQPSIDVLDGRRVLTTATASGIC
jgi:hypothetical protein